MLHYHFLEDGYRVFGLHGATGEQCNCGNQSCEALFKHPISSNWQHTPEWSDEQLETMEDLGHFDTGYGVLVPGLIVVDVDARNGGVKSFENLCKDLSLDLLGNAGLAVSTGSGAGSLHLYFKAPSISLVQHLHNYPGIDFKSSGFVVGPGSRHASGNFYDVLHGSPSEISEAPASLIKLLERKESHRTVVDGQYMDITDDEIRSMLSFLPCDCIYEEWIQIGMAIHDATGAGGFDLWDSWSAKGAKYDSSEMEKKWHSFGKSANPVTLGTLIHLAKENGWQSTYDDVTFATTLTGYEQPNGIDITGVDIRRPPGFVGELTEWINSQCLYPRENLAVAASLAATGNICGLKYKDTMDGFSLNLFAFCVAGSSTGKESVQQAYMDAMRAAGLSPSIHGAFKSEQEVIRNLIRHQMAAYVIDEMGIVLKKVKNATQRGGASYLEGLIGTLMSTYSKANGFMPVSGDVRDEITKMMQAELAALRKRVDENEDKNGRAERRAAQLERALSTINDGLEKPFLSMIGFTTPVTFNDIVDFEQATNGMIARALIFQDLDTNPKRRKGFKKQPMPDSLKYGLASLYAPGEYSSEPLERIEHYGEKLPINTTEDAGAMLDLVYEEFWQQGEQHKQKTGLEAIPRRGYELVGKISCILAAPSGLRTAEHVRWAYALAKSDIDAKMKLAYSNMKAEDKDVMDAVAARIVGCVTQDHGETIGVLVNRCRPHKKDVVEQAIARLIEQGALVAHEMVGGNNRKYTKYYSA